MERLRFGRYETLRLIASGGMAKVYVGRASGPAGFERLVAVKVMHDHIANDPDLGQTFLDEARLAAGIRHPNVVPTLDVAEDGRFLVMELIDGASLRDILRGRREPLDVGLSLRIALDMLEGLHAAHEHKDRDGRSLQIVHRDVSPHNILVGSDGVSRLTDFGIAYAEARLTSTRAGKLKGKMPYMAPEQLRGKQVDRRVDVYAAGCVLWEMLAGERMFSADNDAALACLVLDGPKRTPSAVNARVPAALDDACMQALRPRDARFQNARAFADALEHAADEARIPIARTRDIAALTDGLRPSLAPEETASTTLPPQIALLAEAATTHTQTVDVGDSDLPAAARPVIVSSISSSIPSVEMEGTSASLVAPVERTSSAAPGRVAIATLLAAIVGVTAWFAFRETPAAATSSVASAARVEAASVSLPPKPPPKMSLVSAPQSAAPVPPKRPLPQVARPPAPAPKPPPAATSAAPASAPPSSTVLHPPTL